MSNKGNSRRKFIKKTAIAGVGFSIVPSHAVSGLGHKAPSDKLHIVCVGVGGKGMNNLLAMQSENIIGLCDIDWNYAQKCAAAFPQAKTFYDWRKMFDALGNSIDG